MTEALRSAERIDPTPVSEPMPMSFGRYEVRGIVGEGSMGRIYEGYDPLGNRTVAIKALRPENFTSESRDEYLKRFRREAQAAGALSHPSIVTIYDVGEDYFVMELLHGQTLQSILQETGRLGFDEAMAILDPVAAALDYAHEQGIIHRDIKPANIMVLPDGRVKLTDFGIAHLSSTVMTASGMFLGSPCYMAPEQVQTSEASPRADLFSLAVVAYEMLTGTKAFSGEAITSIVFQVVHVDPPPPTSREPGLPLAIDGVMARALSKDPHARFESGADFVRALRGNMAADGETRRTASGRVIATSTTASGRVVRTSLPNADPEETHDLRTAGIETGEARAPSRLRKPLLWTAAALALVLGGYQAARYLGVAVPALPQALPQPPVQPQPLGLRVETVPAGARVFVDNEQRGLSPLDLADLAAGPHTIRLALAGHVSTEVTLEPLAGSPPLLFRLQPVPKPAAPARSPAPAPTPVTTVVATAPSIEPVHVRPIENPDEIHVEGPGITPPRRIVGEPISYPRDAERFKLQGTVAVEIVVDRDGRPADVKVVESAGEILDKATVEGIAKWKFEPATRNGVKVRFRQMFRQTFRRGD